ncbi:diadenylate cyclase ['Camptotheca acuminata' phytoplasma]|uniref:diadenylate cyclase n=1 Tax='Camptotheca acuminata' phytoplasma TaxID=3239192 RepID=UPI00351A088B
MEIIFTTLLFLLFFFFVSYISFLVFFSKYEFLKIIYSFILIIVFFVFIEKVINTYGLSGRIQWFSFDIRPPLMTFLMLFLIIIKAPYLRYHLQNLNFWGKNKLFIAGSINTHQQILEAVIEMSEKKIGALITIEKNNSLQQFAKKSILIDGNITKELLINIFIPNTPLHDGAVIIRGNKILSAGAYFMLSDKQHFKKTTGSRHRAALGISEITDSMTIVVSEETGNISIALEGILLKMKDINQITEYLEAFIL